MTILIPHSNQKTCIIIRQNDIGKNNVFCQLTAPSNKICIHKFLYYIVHFNG